MIFRMSLKVIDSSLWECCYKISFFCVANQKELVADLITKAKQIEYLINSLPEPEPEEDQVVLGS